MAALESPKDILQYALDRANEDPTVLTGDIVTTLARLFIVRSRELWLRHTWLDLISDPPGVLLTTAPITSLTLTAAVGTAVVGTLSSTVAVTLLGRKIQPVGETYAIRITAHTAGTASVTLDAVPEALTAAAMTVFQDEYTLVSDLGLFVNGFWSDEGDFVPIREEETARMDHGLGISQGWPPQVAIRLTETKVRLIGYPDAIRRLEYPYIAEPADSSDPINDTTTMAFGKAARAVLAEMVASDAMVTKHDDRAPGVAAHAEVLFERAVEYETRRRRPIFSQVSRAQSHSPWAHTR